MKFAFVFPGQGSQAVGMGQDLAKDFVAAKSVLAEVDEALGQDLSGLMANGPIEDLTLTENAQPALMAASLAVMRVLESEFDVDVTAASFVAGHSLGEYSALAAAGSLSISDAAKLLKLRGQSMQKAVPVGEGTMAALLGADEDLAAQAVAAGAEAGVCAIANDNAPGQIVLSGELAALDAVEAAAKDHGIKRAVRLTVAGGFHSECMRPAAERLAAALAEVEIQAPRVPVVSNVTARPVDGPDAIRSGLAQQVCAPVLWEDSMRWALEQGVRSFVEPGPGTVLAGLMRRIAKGVDPAPVVRAAETPADLAGSD